MQVFRDLAEIPRSFGRTLVTVGNFDGVHLAHRTVIKSLVERSKSQNARSVVLTFDPHPLRVLRPDRAPKLITPTPIKLKLLSETGLDGVALLPFSSYISRMSPAEFAETILAKGLRALEVHEGFNFRFGHRAEGDTERLRELGKSLGFEVVVYPPRKLRGHIVSSSQVRKFIQSGHMDAARRLLGRLFSILSSPARGRGYGTQYAVPTINLDRYDELVPGHGVYVTQLRVGEELFQGVTNVGNRPTFGEDSFAIESHLLNFHPVDLSPETPLELYFLKRLRAEVRFPSPEALRRQIMKDVGRARRYFQLLERFSSSLVR
ncbi:MAG TPA: bifunctional riboflavin kinase/FAD synthetase [Terriglobales bacterium]